MVKWITPRKHCNQIEGNHMCTKEITCALARPRKILHRYRFVLFSNSMFLNPCQKQQRQLVWLFHFSHLANDQSDIFSDRFLKFWRTSKTTRNIRLTVNLISNQQKSYQIPDVNLIVNIIIWMHKIPTISHFILLQLTIMSWKNLIPISGPFSGFRRF